MKRENIIVAIAMILMFVNNFAVGRSVFAKETMNAATRNTLHFEDEKGKLFELVLEEDEEKKIFLVTTDTDIKEIEVNLPASLELNIEKTQRNANQLASISYENFLRTIHVAFQGVPSTENQRIPLFVKGISKIGTREQKLSVKTIKFNEQIEQCEPLRVRIHDQNSLYSFENLNTFENTPDISERTIIDSGLDSQVRPSEQYPLETSNSMTKPVEKEQAQESIPATKKMNGEELSDHIVNGSFEEPLRSENTNSIMSQDLVPGWETTANDKAIEIANGTGGRHRFKPAVGNQWAEINANKVGELHQTVKTVPGDELHWQLWHAGRDRTDTMNINIGTNDNHPTERTVSSPNRKWTKYTGVYIVPEQQYETYFGFQSVKSLYSSYGNYIDGVRFYVPGRLKASKSVEKNIVNTGDIITYTINVTNESGRGMLYDIKVEDNIPSGLELVSESLQVDGKTVNNQSGNHAISTVIPTVDKNQTVKVTFQAKVIAQESRIINNIATVTDPIKPNEPKTAEVNINVIHKKGKLDSEKKVYNSEGESIDNQMVRVGDIIEYRILAKNTGGTETIVNNVKLQDAIPNGLSYETGTLMITYPDGTTKDLPDNQVNGQQLTTENIGNLKGGETATVSFKVKVNERATGILKNIAMIKGTIPPENSGGSEIHLETETPERSVGILSEVTGEKLVNGTNANKAYVNDTLSYTIQVNHTEGTGQWIGSIIDKLPEYLSYIAGTTTVNGKTKDDNEVWQNNILTIPDRILNDKEKLVTVEFKATIKKEGVGTAIKNKAEIKPTLPNGSNQPNESKVLEASTEVVPSPGKLDSEKKVYNSNGAPIDNQKVKIGDIIEYRIIAKNTGDNETIVNQVKIKDVIPTGLIYEPGTFRIAYSDGTINTLLNEQVTGQQVVTENLGNLKGGEGMTVSFKVKVTDQTTETIKNIAIVKGTVPPEKLEDPDRPFPPQKREVLIFRHNKLQTNAVNENRKNKNYHNIPLTGEKPSLILSLWGLIIVLIIGYCKVYKGRE